MLQRSSTAVCVLLAISLVQAYVTDEPMVAFVCNRPAMHSTDRGWISDDSTNCIDDPVDVLNYCRKMYPHLDVWNVVEASEKVTIANWCNFAHNNCHHRFKVRPFRCLVGAFQSEALRVPEHCQFDHVHDSTECKTYDSWNRTTSEACLARHGATLHRFSVLQPCAIDGFNGAEFVCCPTEEHLLTTTSTPVSTTKLAPPTTWMTSSPNHHHHHRDNDDDDVTSGKDNKHHVSEHARFVRAKTELEKRHHEKVNKMMKEWSAARRRVQEIKKIDMKGGEKFNREMTARFQKAYESLEHESALERKKLMAEHQQYIQDELARKKTEAMNDYLDALADDEPDASRVMTSLLQYVKAEQKDRVHTINHYEHVEQSDPVEAEVQRSTVAAHLRGIDERVTQAIDMLARLPRFQRKIRAQIERFLSNYQSLDESLAVIMAKINEKSNKTPGKSFMTAMTSDAAEELTTVAIPKQDLTTAGVMSVAATATEATENERSPVVTPSSTKRSPETTPAATTAEEGASRRFVAVKQVVQHRPAAAHSQNSDFSVLESYIEKMPVRPDRGGHLAAPLAIAVCGVAVLALVVAGLAMARRGRSTASDSLSVTEIDRSTPRVGHPGVPGTRPLPVNGYENPTYQYYQAAEAAATEAGKDAAAADQ